MVQNIFTFSCNSDDAYHIMKLKFNVAIVHPSKMIVDTIGKLTLILYKEVPLIQQFLNTFLTKASYNASYIQGVCKGFYYIASYLCAYKYPILEGIGWLATFTVWLSYIPTTIGLYSLCF